MRSLIRSLILAAVCLICGGALVGWNYSRFIGVKMKGRMKELSFMPAPTVAKLLALGQRNTVAKLRWIDSFSYFQWQVERVGYGLAGPESIRGFQKLYDTLIELDPLFEPFYQHAALCTGGLLGQHYLALGYLQRGLLELPHNTDLWRHAASILSANFNFEETQPEHLDQFLSQWAASETSEDKRLAVDVWKGAMGRRKFKGIEQLPYWLDRLRGAKPGTPTTEFIDATVRELLVNYTCDTLSALAAEYRRRTGKAATSVDQVLKRDLMQALQLRLPSWFGLVLKSDPFGLPYRVDGDQVVSVGLERLRYQSTLSRRNGALESKARKTGQRPWTLAEAMLETHLPPTPPDGELHYDEGVLSVTYPPPLSSQWDLRQLDAATGGG